MLSTSEVAEISHAPTLMKTVWNGLGNGRLYTGSEIGQPDHALHKPVRALEGQFEYAEIYYSLPAA